MDDFCLATRFVSFSCCRLGELGRCWFWLGGSWWSGYCRVITANIRGGGWFAMAPAAGSRGAFLFCIRGTFLRCPTDKTVDVDNGKTVDDCEHPWDEATTVVIVVEPVCLVTTDDQRRIHPHCHPFYQSPIHLKPSVSGPSPFVAWEVHPNLLVLFWFLSRVVPNDWLWFLWKIDEEISWTDSALPLVSYPSRVVVLVNWAGATTRPPRWR